MPEIAHQNGDGAIGHFPADGMPHNVPVMDRIRFAADIENVSAIPAFPAV